MHTRFAFFLICCFVPALAAVQPPAEYVGHWTGTAHIGVDFVQQQTLHLDLTVQPDGIVKGSVGDARVTRGEFIEHNWYEKLFGNRGYVLKVSLEGDLVASEKVHRDGAYVIVEYVNGALTGGVNSFGSKGFPGAASSNRNRMMVSCSRLRLQKAA